VYLICLLNNSFVCYSKVFSVYESDPSFWSQGLFLCKQEPPYAKIAKMLSQITPFKPLVKITAFTHVWGTWFSKTSTNLSSLGWGHGTIYHMTVYNLPSKHDAKPLGEVFYKHSTKIDVHLMIAHKYVGGI